MTKGRLPESNGMFSFFHIREIINAKIKNKSKKMAPKNPFENKEMWYYCILYNYCVTAWIQANADVVYTI